MNIEELIKHTNIIIEKGLDSEDDIQLILKKWKTAYEKEKEKNKRIKDILQKYAHTQVGDEEKILEFYKELKETFI